MKGDWKETEILPVRELKLGELLFLTFELMKKRLGSFLLLALLLYLPSAALQQYQLSQIVLTEDVQALLEQMIPVAVGTAVMMFLTIIGPMIAAVLIVNELYDEQRLTFPAAFYKGIRRYPAAALTLVILLAGLILAELFLSMLMTILPLLLMLILPLLTAVLLYFGLLQSSSAATASLRGLLGMNNLGYVRAVFGQRMLRCLGIYAFVWIIGNLPGMLIGLVAGELLAFIEIPWLVNGLSVLLEGLLGIFSLFTASAVVLMLLNCEKIREREWREKQNIPPVA